MLDEKTTRALAAAIVDRPRATLQELAQAAGISKATLYRCSRTREQLIDDLRKYCADVMMQQLQRHQIETAEPLQALKCIIEFHLEHVELSSFIFYHWQQDTPVGETPVELWSEHTRILDQVFLRGQQQGLFRVDVSAQTLSDACGFLICGLADSARCGRSARFNLAGMVESLFLHGASCSLTDKAL